MEQINQPQISNHRHTEKEAAYVQKLLADNKEYFQKIVSTYGIYFNEDSAFTRFLQSEKLPNICTASASQ